MTMNLADLNVIALDCQATGANPQKGHLLEIGWIQTHAAANLKPEASAASVYPIALPPNVDIPPAVQRITGITRADSARALPAAEVWCRLLAAADEVAVADQIDKCPIIIHYSRFEMPFLKHLHARMHRQDAFPFRVICTHEIARRLLPGLPRRGLRSVAGYYGHSVPLSRRSADHAVATAVIWHHLIDQLRRVHGIRTIRQLSRWLKCTPGQSRAARIYPMRREIRLKLPEKPGIYRMLRSNGDLLYIGKAASLKHRINSYFRQKGRRAEHTLEMLSQAADLDTTLTGSALEAALLESDEIKRLCPPYNVALQEGRRKLLFFSRDLRKCTGNPDKVHPIGPLPAGSITSAMTAFGAWLTDTRPAGENGFFEIGCAILGVPERVAPEPDCIAEGLELFRSIHLLRFEAPSALRIITALGREFWRENLETRESNEPETAADAIDADPIDPVPESESAPAWTPGMVARGVETFTMRSAFLIRRARWLCLLSESSLAWTAREAGGRRKIVLRFKNGAVADRLELAGTAEVTLPAGYARRPADRRKIFDLATYERLRVVTTELRRLVAEGRNIEIRLRPNAVLGGRQLERMLAWV